MKKIHYELSWKRIWERILPMMETDGDFTVGEIQQEIERGVEKQIRKKIRNREFDTV
jgi:hypothetical protein